MMLLVSIPNEAHVAEPESPNHRFKPTGLASTGDPTFVVPGSMLGVPALSLPVLNDGGLPLGLQLVGFADRDAALFATAAGVLAAMSA